jgi:hypothetical protein
VVLKGASLTADKAIVARGAEAGKKAEAEPRRARRVITALNMVDCEIQEKVYVVKRKAGAFIFKPCIIHTDFCCVSRVRLRYPKAGAHPNPDQTAAALEDYSSLTGCSLRPLNKRAGGLVTDAHHPP